jgi:flavodoxin
MSVEFILLIAVVSSSVFYFTRPNEAKDIADAIDKKASEQVHFCELYRANQSIDCSYEAFKRQIK